MVSFKRLSSRLGARLGHSVARVWEGLSGGWAELLQRSSGALTAYQKPLARPADGAGAAHDFPRWGLLAGETWETAGNIIVRLEVPGVSLQDLQVWVQGQRLHVHGLKHAHDPRSPAGDGPAKAGVGAPNALPSDPPDYPHYHLMERAYGHFERSFDLPARVDGDAAEVTLVEGVVTVILPKTDTLPPTLTPTRPL